MTPSRALCGCAGRPGTHPREVDSVSVFKPVLVSAGVLLAGCGTRQEITGGRTFSDQVVKPTYVVGSALGLTGAFMLALALLALQAWRAERTVGAGRAAAIAAGFGTMLLFAINWS